MPRRSRHRRLATSLSRSCVDAEEFGRYSWRSRSIKDHRAQIRAAFGFREFSRGDEDKLAGWLAEEVCPVELREGRLRQAVLVRCRAEGIEPPGRLDRIIGSARSTFEQRFCQRTVERLSAASVAALEALVAEDDSAVRGLLAELKADRPGRVGDGAGRDRQADRGAPAGAAERVVRRRLGEAGGRLAGAGDALVPVRPAG
ncbi:DUF4158 domain-containing protein [Actinopolyspora xinjiangensis]|uniref:DUF4158 domain-containing protein n=1 Tax=Actinopolyspora xinjiangensis TaxID=405564 RepID=UPI003CC79E5C